MKKIVLLTLSLIVAATAFAGARDSSPDADTTKFDRGINVGRGGMATFIPKGTIAAGLTLSYNNYSIGNGIDDDGYSMLLSLLQNTRGNYESFGISPHVSYFIRKNMSVGARFSYDRDWLSLGNLDIDLGNDLEWNINNFSYYKNSYSMSVFARNFIPFGKSKRFAMFYELRATYGYGESKSYSSGYDEVIDQNYREGNFTTINKFEIGVIPGLIAFLSDTVAAEVSIGMLGFKYQKNKQTRNQVETSEMENTSANFKANLLSISFGVSYYIPTGNQRKKK